MGPPASESDSNIVERHVLAHTGVPLNRMSDTDLKIYKLRRHSGGECVLRRKACRRPAAERARTSLVVPRPRSPKGVLVPAALIGTAGGLVSVGDRASVEANIDRPRIAPGNSSPIDPRTVRLVA